MTSYILRNIDPQLWKDFKETAAGQGHTVRWLLMTLIASYVIEFKGKGYANAPKR